MFEFIRKIFKLKKVEQKPLNKITSPPPSPAPSLQKAPSIKSHNLPNYISKTVTPPEQIVDPEIKKLYDEFVLPYKDIFSLHQASKGILNLLELLQKYGHCPSLRLNSKFSNILSPQVEVFSKVSLKEHSINTAREIIKLVNYEIKGDNTLFMPIYITAALGHDIGKVPEFSNSKYYVTADHPIIGANIVRRCFEKSNVSWIEDVVQAIINHHRQSTKPLDRLLVLADQFARGKELIQF